MGQHWLRALKIAGITTVAVVAFLLGVFTGRNRPQEPTATVQEVGDVNEPPTSTQTLTFAINESIDSKFGPLRVQSRIVDLYPGWKLREKFNRISRAERMKVLQEIGINPSDASYESALTRGVFDPVTAVLGSLQRFLGSSAFATMPPVFDLPRKWTHPLTIRVVGSLADMGEQSSLEPPFLQNGYYSRDQNTIAIYVDPTLLNFLFGAAESTSPSWNEAGDAWVVLRRTLMKPLYHELTHALQAESARSCFWNRFLAEGQAEYFSDLVEREEIVGPFFAREILARHSAQASGKVEAKTIEEEVRNYLSDVRQGRVLQPFEYARVASVLASSSGRATLLDLLARSGDKFVLDSPQQAYDTAWAFFQFLVVQPGGEKTAETLARMVDELQVSQNADQLALLERQMFTRLHRFSGPVGKTEVGNVLVNATKTCDESQLVGKYWKCYLSIAHLLASVPEEPILWAYLGDVFRGADERDMFVIYYGRAIAQRNQGTQMSGNIRVINRGVGALWDIGRIREALALQREYTITSLDLPSIMEMTLRNEFANQANQANWKPEAVGRLETEYELGLALINLSALVNSSTVDKAIAGNSSAAAELKNLREAGSQTIRSRVNKWVFELGYPQGRIPDDAWFLQDYQLLQRRIDIHDLCLGGANGCSQERSADHPVAQQPNTAVPDVSAEGSMSATNWYFRGQNATDPHDKIEAYTHTIDAKADYYLPALINRCLAYRDAKDYQSALADCTHAVELAPREVVVHNNLGWAYQGAGDYQKAIESYSRAIEINPGYLRAFQNRADCYLAVGDFAHAVRDLEEAVRISPDNATYNDLAWLLIDHRLDLDRGIELANKAVELGPENANHLDTLGWGYYCRGDYDKSLQILSRAYRLAPSNDEIRRHYEAAQKASTTGR